MKLILWVKEYWLSILPNFYFSGISVFFFALDPMANYYYLLALIPLFIQLRKPQKAISSFLIAAVVLFSIFKLILFFDHLNEIKILDKAAIQYAIWGAVFVSLNLLSTSMLIINHSLCRWKKKEARLIARLY